MTPPQPAQEGKTVKPDPYDAFQRRLAINLWLLDAKTPEAQASAVKLLSEAREKAAAEVRALGTPIRWYHRLWWRVQRGWT